MAMRTKIKAAKTTKAAKAKKAAKPARAKKSAAVDEAKTKKMGVLSAAAQVLAETGATMSSKELIEAIVAGGHWTSPAGKTPHATLYSAMIREIAVKGNAARFRKMERGKFAANA